MIDIRAMLTRRARSLVAFDQGCERMERVGSERVALKPHKPISGPALVALVLATLTGVTRGEAAGGLLSPGSQESNAAAGSAKLAQPSEVGTLVLDFDADAWNTLGCSMVGSLPVAPAYGAHQVRLDISHQSTLAYSIATGGRIADARGKLRTHGGMLLDCPDGLFGISEFTLVPLDDKIWVLSAVISGDRADRLDFAIHGLDLEPDAVGSIVGFSGQLILTAASANRLSAPTMAEVKAGSLTVVWHVHPVVTRESIEPERLESQEHGLDKAAPSVGPAPVGALSSVGADVIVGDIQSFRRWARINGITAYSIGTTSCNVGDVPLNWFRNAPEHPVIAQNLYRLKNGRFEQIALSWVKHGFTASVGELCSGPGQCVPEPTDEQLGVGCSDIYSNTLNGFQANMGPRALVNPTTGEFPFPYDAPAFSGELDRRLQVADADLDPALNAGARYFAEAHYITSDDAADGNQDNNASYREFSVVETSPQVFNLAFTPGNPTERGLPAIWAWAAVDPQVRMAIVDVPGDRRLLVGTRVTDLGDGRWEYEYAVQNLNSDRAVGAFGVPVTAGTDIQSTGFRDVHDHSGAPFDTTDWSLVVDPSDVTWHTQDFALNPNANALRWGSLYNFRFVADVCPVDGRVRLGLFKPGDPSVVFADAPVPGSPAQLIASNPPDGAIDARQPSDPDGSHVTGWQQVRIQWSAPPCRAFSASDFHVSQFGGTQPAPVVAEVHVLADDEIEIILDRPIADRAWTLITHAHSGERIRLGFLPADANGDGTANARDILALIDMLNGVRATPGPWATDIDRSGKANAADITRLIDLLNGSSQYERYFAATLPPVP